MKIEEIKNQTTPISNAFIDKYLPLANGAFLKVYIYVYRCSYFGVCKTSSEIAKELNLLESDVITALKYWEEENMLALNNNTISFKESNIETSKPTIKKRKLVLDARPNYSTEEMAIYTSSNPEVRELFMNAQEILGHYLKKADSEILFGLHDWLMLPFDVIEFLLSYCAANDKTNLRYIEKVAIDWSNKGIDTLEKAKSHVDLNNNVYRKIFKELKISSMTPSDAQIEFMNKWLNDLKFDLEIILLACKKTVDQTGKANFKYIDSILNAWKKENVVSIDDIIKLDEAHESSKVLATSSSGQTKQKNNKFLNFPQRDWNFDEISKIKREQLKR
ncbi:MAG: DnaD domain protein [Clostridia bacterium]|jgi:DnaD/phage-associated family protein|nr:DnaD domain protein [Clostridia bacterium]